jgi:Domain of unknown function (DUF5615)
MRIKLDENLPAELADDLRQLGHLVDTVADEGLEGRADPVVADAARTARRCLFSLDRVSVISVDTLLRLTTALCCFASNGSGETLCAKASSSCCHKLKCNSR